MTVPAVEIPMESTHGNVNEATLPPAPITVSMKTNKITKGPTTANGNGVSPMGLAHGNSNSPTIAAAEVTSTRLMTTTVGNSLTIVDREKPYSE